MNILDVSWSKKVSEVVKKTWLISYSLIPRPIKCFVIKLLLNTALSVLFAHFCCCFLLDPLEFTVVSNVQLAVLVIMFLKLGEEQKKISKHATLLLGCSWKSSLAWHLWQQSLVVCFLISRGHVECSILFSLSLTIFLFTFHLLCVSQQRTLWLCTLYLLL